MATEAHLIKVDPSTGAVLTDVVPVPGAASINELIIGPDGNLWGLADGIVFVVNPTTGAVLRQIPVFSGRTGANDGALSSGATATCTASPADGCSSWTASAASRPCCATTVSTGSPRRRTARTTRCCDRTARTNPTNLASYTAPADTCPQSDLRATVWTGNIDSHVMNRFLTYGCTLTDVLPDAEADWPSHAAYVSAVDKKVRELETDGTVERWEGVLIRIAAARSDVGQ